MADALTKKALANLAVFTGFLTAAAGTTGLLGGAITEVGIPQARADSSPHAVYVADVPLWKLLLDRWMQAADTAQLDVLSWSGGQFGDYELATHTNDSVFTSSGTNIDKFFSPGGLDIFEAHPPAVGMSYRRGDNFAGGEFGHKTLLFTNDNPGTYGTDYFLPTAGDAAAIAARRIRTIRLPISWERVQPTLLGALNSTYLGYITAFVNACAANGVGVILDLHNYARYEYNNAGSKDIIVLRREAGIDLTTTGPTAEDTATMGPEYLSDVWARLSDVYRDNAGVIGYELMNEPHDVKPSSGSFSGTTLNDWNAGTVAGWTGGVGVTLSHTTSSPYEGSGSLRGSGTTDSGGGFTNFRAERGSVSGTGNVLRGRVRLNGTPTGAWQARFEWQTSGFSWQVANSVNLTAGAWVEVACDFSANPIAGSAINLCVQVHSSNPAASQAVTFDVDLFERGALSGVLTDVQAWEAITQDVVNHIRLRPDNVTRRDTKTIYIAGHGWNVLSWSHAGPWITEPGAAPGTHKYVTHQYFDSQTNGDGDSAGTYYTDIKTYANSKTRALAQGYTDDADVTLPTISSSVTVGSIGSTSAIVSWTTNETCDSRVEYGINNALVPPVYGSSTVRDAALVLSHSVSLTGLTASTTYKLRARSSDAAGLYVESGDVTFTTLSAGAPPGPGGSGSSSGGGMPSACFSSQERLFYIRPDGIRYPLHARPWRTVLSQEGFGTPPLEYVVDRAPFQHGDTVRTVHMGPRPVQLVVLHNFKSRADYRNGRELFLDTVKPQVGLSPPQPGKLLYYLANGQRRQLDVLLDSGPGFVQPEGGWREWSFTEAIRFTAHNPTWYDPTAVISTFVFTAAQNQLIFPVTFPISFSGNVASIGITYTGSWVEYPVIVVTGPVLGFSIENITTGDIIAFTGDIPAGYSVTINLQGIKTVVGSDGTNWINQLSADSDLATFSLLPDPTAPGGVNQIRVNGSGTNVNSFVSLTWYKRYFGI